MTFLVSLSQVATDSPCLQCLSTYYPYARMKLDKTTVINDQNTLWQSHFRGQDPCSWKILGESPSSQSGLYIPVSQENLFVIGAITFFTSAPGVTQPWGVTNHPNCLVPKMTL